MSRYRKIEVRTWSDEKFRDLSPIQPSGQGLWFFLLTGPHTTAIPGLFRAGRAAMAEELGWDQEAFDEAFQEVFDKGMAKADFKARLVWLPNAIRHNKPESPNVVKSWRAEVDLLPECQLKNEAILAISEYLEGLGESFINAFKNNILEQDDGGVKGGKSNQLKPSPKASAKPSPKTKPNQEQEQEQELVEAKQQRGSRLPADWNPSDVDKQFCKTERPDLDPEKTADRFRDYWVSQPGSKGVKLNWSATWRNWVRNETRYASAQPQPRDQFAGSI